MRTKTTIGTIILCCALAGGAAAVLEGTASATRVSVRGRPPAVSGPWPWQTTAGPPVHAVSVVPNRANNGFVTLTIDAGQITSVGTGTIVLREGTKQRTYATPSLTIPTTSTITLDGKGVSLDQLAAGDSAFVSASPAGTTVRAWDESSANGAWPANPTEAHGWPGHQHGAPYPGHSWAARGGVTYGAPGEGPGAW